MNQENIYQGSPANPQQAQHPAYAGGSGGGNSPLAPLNLLRIVARRWPAVVLLTIAGGLSGLLFSQYAQPVFKAEAELEMNVRRPRVINNEAVFEDSSLVRDEGVIFNTRFAKFRSPAMEKLATEEYYKKYPEENVPSRHAGMGKYQLSSLIADVEWSKDPKANIVRVYYLSHDPEFAARLVNVLSECAGLLMMQENQALSDEAVKWLVSQAREQLNSLEEVDRQLSRIREESQLDSLQHRKTVLQQSLVAVSAECEALIGTLSSRQTVYDFVKRLQGTDANLEMLPPGLPKEEQLYELIQAWRSANEELLLASGRYTQLHPEYRQAAEKELRARGRLEQFIELSSRSVQNEIELLNRQVEQTKLRMESMKQEMVELDRQLVVGMQRIQALERQREAADNAYQAMLRRMEEARLSADENMAFAQVIREAEVPRVPVSPKRPVALVVGTLLGGFVGCLVVVLVALLTDKIASVNDIKALRLNILGVIPSQKKVDSRSELATIGLRDKFCHIVEIFAGINALLSSDKFMAKTRMLLVSSAMPGEGKTVSACNLAISSALNGTRTLLIDGDLRRPQLVNVFAVDGGHPSLLEWLMGNTGATSCESLLNRNVIDNLDVIISRPIREVNPAELLGRGRLAELLKWARKHYDRIIIDSPPMGAVGDGQVLANLVDSVIVVSRVGKTRRRALRFALARFQEIDANVLGCIANDVPNSLVGMFGGAEGYGYGYGYGYGGYKNDGQE